MLINRSHDYFKRPDHNTIFATFLLSRKFSDWALDADFIRTCVKYTLKDIANPEKPSPFTEKLPPLRLELLVAVVDAIPRPGWTFIINGDVIADGSKFSPLGENGQEGFAYCISGHEQQAAPETMDDLSSATAPRTPSSSEAQATLYFDIKDFDSDHHQASRKVKLPLAKTLFYNGLQHTMLSSTWVENNATRRFELVKEQQHQHATVIIPVLHSFTKHLPVASNRWWVTSPLLPLTPSREVKASMGNIIRQIGDDDGPASTELETAVMKFYADNDLPVEAAAVWALVVPQETASQLKAEGASELMHEDAECKRQQMAIGLNTVDAFSSVPYRLMLRGARLHKVLSGGGGWGKKAGLLSLDPESDYSDVDPTAPPRLLDLDSLFSDSEPDPVKPIASPGDYVRFYIAPNLPEEALPPQKPNAYGRQTRQTYRVQSLEFGVLPSSMDDVQMSAEDAAEAAVETTRQKIQVHERHFGALSEGGMSVRIADEEGMQTMLSKVDVPYARFSLQNYHHDPTKTKEWKQARREENAAAENGGETEVKSNEDSVPRNTADTKSMSRQIKAAKNAVNPKPNSKKDKVVENRPETAADSTSGVSLAQALQGRRTGGTRYGIRNRKPSRTLSRSHDSSHPSPNDDSLLARLDSPLTTNPLIRRHESEPRIIHQPANKEQQVRDAAQDAARIEDRVRAKQSQRMKEIARLRMKDQQNSGGEGAADGGVVRRYVNDRLTFAADARSDMQASRQQQSGPSIHRYHVAGLEDSHMHNRDTSKPLSGKLVREIRRDEVGDRDDGSMSSKRMGMVRDMLEKRRQARDKDSTVSERLEYTSEEWMEKMKSKDKNGQLFL